MIKYTSDCCGTAIQFNNICSECGNTCLPLPTSETINEMIINKIDCLKFDREDPFLYRIWMDIKGKFFFEANAHIEKYNYLIYDCDFDSINFTVEGCEDNLILVIEEKTKLEIIEKLNVC